ncbi:hypothetical protein C7974DRAFT_113255 [Boeremia exigua]|uniref:uncharacterized protein n=1 Tax=Boeremia exigua TaxID=749465 RepID=UPI001E8D8796|nr:uncharacterized protein C7974DRAFT_113255 [Boeremia exigua]KAH6642956.1 hypothetical protein C7974DRAFT_113255 [Boeremia exigua]
MAVQSNSHAVSKAITSSPSSLVEAGSALIQQGAAILRSTACLPDIEYNCGSNSLFNACCPSTLTCVGMNKFRCCLPWTNCATEQLCANSSWALFDNNGYCCCDRDSSGYNLSHHQACLGQGTSISSGTLLPTLLIDPAATPSLIETIVPAGSSSKAAAIGGILGGIVGFAIVVRVTWVILRHKRRKRLQGLACAEDRLIQMAREDMRRSQQLDNLYAMYGDEGGKSRYFAHNKEQSVRPSSFELQWSSIQSPRSGQPAAI